MVYLQWRLTHVADASEDSLLTSEMSIPATRSVEGGTSMKLSRILVDGLFDLFSHEIVLSPENPITIMIGPNGFGKTMILKMIDTLFNKPIIELSSLPFRLLRCDFEGGESVSIIRESKLDGPGNGKGRSTLTVSYHSPDAEAEPFTPVSADPADLGIPLNSIEDVIPVLDQIATTQWLHRGTGEILSLDDVVERFWRELPINEESTRERMPHWLKQLRESISVRFIEADRLQRRVVGRQTVLRRRHLGTASERTVTRYSRELGELIQKTFTQYGALSQKLDRTFPQRVVGERVDSQLSVNDVLRQLDEIDTKRSRLMEAGLLFPDVEPWRIPLETVDESRRGVLAVYARDAEKKLSVFDDVFARVDIFKRIANKRLLHKKVVVEHSGFHVVTADGMSLELEVLSSGEQQELLLLYEFLFRVGDNSIILIDEPELSLHVAWQEEFLNDLLVMADLSRFRVLIATHSPTVIGDRWDLTIKLKGPGE